MTGIFKDILPGKTYGSASEIVSSIRRGELTTEAVVRYFLEQIKEKNASIRAVVQVFEPAALQRARAADAALDSGVAVGPLHGLPVTIKEAFDMTGTLTTLNFRPRRWSASGSDAAVVTQLRKAGAIIIGKTNVPMLLIDQQTAGWIYGRARHPHNPAFTPGGSSGGGAAAVAAGLSPLDIGSDSGGSLRLPAHFCGVCSLKPTTGTISLEGLRPPFSKPTESFRLIVGAGPIARTVEDLSLGYAAIRKPSSGVRFSPGAAGKALSEYNLAWTDRLGVFYCDDQIRTIIADRMRQISRLGCAVEFRQPDLPYEMIYRCWGYLFGNIARQSTPPFLRWAAKLGFRFLPGADPVFGPIMAKGMSADPRRIEQILKQRKELMAMLESFFTKYDFLVCPVAVVNAFTHRRMGRSIETSDQRHIPYWQNSLPFVTPFNLTGHPVLVLPIGNTPNGLPVGIQIVARLGADRELLQFGQLLERSLSTAES